MLYAFSVKSQATARKEGRVIHHETSWVLLLLASLRVL